MVERLPTLYPMPWGREQFWTIVQLARQNLPYTEFLTNAFQTLKKIDSDEPYDEEMVKRLVSNLTTYTGFLIKNSDGHGVDRIALPRQAEQWTGDEQGFQKYVGATIRRWGDRDIGFYTGVVLVNDILACIGPHGIDRSHLYPSLVASPESTGRYDGDDKYGRRTVTEFLKLLRFAGWINEADGRLSTLLEGRRARAAMLQRDILYRAKREILLLGSDTDAFTREEKIAMSRYYMYRQCGGKGKDFSLGGAVFDALFVQTKTPGRFRRSPRLIKSKKTLDAEKKEILAKVRAWDPVIAKDFEGTRNLQKLRTLSAVVDRDDRLAADELSRVEGGRFSWERVKHLRHAGNSFSLDSDLHLYDWQTKALEQWIANGRRGVFRVVTGAGKTVAALQAISAVHQISPDARVTILVPTKVLMYQWARELVRLLAIPAEDIGLRGDGYRDRFSAGKRVLVAIVNSAVRERFLAREAAALPSGAKHFLIADECHRYSGPEFRKAFEAPTEFCLGLSATPKAPGVNGNSEPVTEPDVVAKLGGVVFNYTYGEALAAGIIQPFEVHYLGVELTSSERLIYDNFTKKIARAIERILLRYGPLLGTLRGTTFDQRLQTLLLRLEHPDPGIFDYFRFVRERKDLVFKSINRKRCYLDLITRHRKDKVIVFHERIEDLEDIVAPLDRRMWEREDVEDVFTEKEPAAASVKRLDRDLALAIEDLFVRSDFRPVMYHSGHAEQIWNTIAMDWFRDDTANVMLSVKALVEGVDVPAARIGIIRTSSSSVRQRIQTTGRILRRARGKTATAALYVIYVRDTTDERIFKEFDWAEELGGEAVKSFYWFPPADDTQVPSGRLEDRGGEIPHPVVYPEDRPPPVPSVESLVAGDSYPGRYVGYEYHVDAAGRPFKRTRQGRSYISNPEVLAAAALLRRLKGGGKFLITPQGHLISRIAGKGVIYLGSVGQIQFSPPSRRRARTKLSRPPTFEELFGEAGG